MRCRAVLSRLGRGRLAARKRVQRRQRRARQVLVAAVRPERVGCAVGESVNKVGDRTHNLRIAA